MLLLKSSEKDRSIVPPCGFLPQQPRLPLLSLRIRVWHPNTRIYVRLLGPCFKTGGLKPFCQHREPSNFLTSLSTNLSHKQNFVLLRARASRNKEEQKRVIIPLSGPTHRNPVVRRLPKKLSTTDLTDADQPTQQDPST